MLREHAGASADELAQAVTRTVETHGNGAPRDDYAALVFAGGG